MGNAIERLREGFPVRMVIFGDLFEVRWIPPLTAADRRQFKLDMAAVRKFLATHQKRTKSRAAVSKRAARAKLAG